MCGIKAWAEAHMDEVLANREQYETRVQREKRLDAASR